MAALHDKLRELREARGLSQRELARLLGISHTRLRAYEAGETPATGNPALPSPELLHRWAARLDYPEEILLGLAGYRMAETPARYLNDVEVATRELLASFGRMNAPQRHLLLGIARLLEAEGSDPSDA